MDESVEEKEVLAARLIPQQGAPADKKRIRLLILLIVIAITTVFFVLSFSYFSKAIGILCAVVIGLIALLSLLAVVFSKETVYKLCITGLYVAAVVSIAYFALGKSGVLASIESTNDLVAYINHSGGVAEVLFVLANFLQVTIVPIPSTITTTAGAVLFDGIWKPLYLTVIGLVIGSMLAFFLGRVFGVRFANWLVGEKTIAKYREMSKGRDKVVLFYMFLFPFFPDDFLCILAGMTDYSYLGFFLLQVFSRTIGTLVTILITKGIVSIPFAGWWLALWVFVILLVIVLFILTVKYSEQIERWVMKLIDKLTFGFSERHREKKAQKAECADVAEYAVKEGESFLDPPQNDEQGEREDDTE